jgi:hypothetical protein
VKKCEKLILMLAKRVREMPDILVTARGRRQRWREAEAERGRAGGRRMGGWKVSNQQTIVTCTFFLNPKPSALTLLV